MPKPPLVSIEGLVSPETSPELKIDSLESIETWYRNLRPDRDMRTIPYETHLDAIASAVLHTSGRELPENAGVRVRTVLALTANTDRTAREVALAGAGALIVSDLLLELTERDKELPKEAVDKLLTVSSNIALDVRDNPTTSNDDKIKANTRYYNAKIARLENNNANLDENKKSDAYIELVRAEAMWMSKHTRGAHTGMLFEVYVGCLAKYQLWVAEEDGHQVARHATLREDQPSRRRDGGSGHDIAHDVTVGSNVAKVLLQCKWGSAAHEFGSDRYDENKVKLIVETGDEGVLENNQAFENAFLALAKSSDSKNMDYCDQMASKYELDLVVDSVRNVTPRAVGSTALVGSV